MNSSKIMSVGEDEYHSFAKRKEGEELLLFH